MNKITRLAVGAMSLLVTLPALALTGIVLKGANDLGAGAHEWTITGSCPSAAGNKEVRFTFAPNSFEYVLTKADFDRLKCKFNDQYPDSLSLDVSGPDTIAVVGEKNTAVTSSSVSCDQDIPVSVDDNHAYVVTFGINAGGLYCEVNPQQGTTSTTSDTPIMMQTPQPHPQPNPQGSHVGSAGSPPLQNR